MRRAGIFALAALLGGCAHWYEDDSRAPAKVENRSVPGSVAASRQAVERTRQETRDASEADLRRIIDRQSRRISELESSPGRAEGEAKQVVDLIAYSQRLSGLSADEQKRELAAANKDYSSDPGLYTRLKLAIVLAAPGSTLNDDAKAASLLEAAASQPARTPLRQFAVLVHGLIQERLRDQKSVAQLKEQLDGLRAIERSLIDREQGKAK
jgi:hypothetical protein